MKRIAVTTDSPVRTSRVLTGVAGVHYVVAVLCQRNMIALPTIRNVAGYDIIVTSSDGRHHANIQVKTSSNPSAHMWLMPPSTKVRSGRHDWYVLLRPSSWGGELYEIFMLRGSEALKEVARRENELAVLARTGRKNIGPSIHPKPAEAQKKLTKWSRTWSRWQI